MKGTHSKMSSLSALGTTTLVPTRQSTNDSSLADKDDLEQKKTDFLKLLLTQLQNQNPLEPLDTNEYTAQLIQYSELEQLIELNDKSGKQLEHTNNNVTATALSYMGKEVEVGTNIAPVQNNQAKWSYTLDGVASEVYLTVTTKSGRVIWEGEGDKSPNVNGFTLDTTGSDVANGEVLYLSVNPEDSKGNKLKSEISSLATVDGVKSSEGKTFLTSGVLTYQLSNILKIIS